jgi:hypothetical protein
MQSNYKLKNKYVRVLMRGAAEDVPDLPSVALNGYRTETAVMALGEHRAVGGIRGTKSGQNFAKSD